MAFLHLSVFQEQTGQSIGQFLHKPPLLPSFSEIEDSYYLYGGFLPYGGNLSTFNFRDRKTYSFSTEAPTVWQNEGQTYFNMTGNSGMATAGSGDVLTGLLLGLLAQGYTPEAACCTGVYLHGLAGDIAARELGEDSMLASDLVRHLPEAFLQLRNPSLMNKTIEQ